jgi:histidinol dehydrogenase
VTEVAPGSTVTERYLPVGRAGVYVPGGLVAYPSSVLMNVIPAQVAGVSEIAVASPPRADGSDRAGLPHAVVLAACALLGITEVHAAGGAQAVAMLGYGTADCASVDVITGPGNVYVAAAKRLLSGLVAVDAEAGPTEIAVIADRDADPALVAADLVAQAEHDRLAACLLISTDAGLADRVDAEVARLTGEPADPRAAGAAGESAGDGTGARSDRTAQQSASARTGAREATVGQDAVQAARERILAALRGQSACVLVDNLDAALAVADSWAPEHLEIQAADAAGLARRVRNAGAVFAGPFAPVSLGDYLAGSNHVLPTGGTARHSGGLSVLSFLRCVHLVECDRAALAAAAPYIDALGAAEDLPGHVAAVRARVASAPSAGHRAGPGRR